VSTNRRLGRLLAMVPWVAAADGPRVADVCERFGCTEAELMADLERLFMCGLYPYTPDTLVDVDFSGGRVWIRYADFFARPLRLTPGEALALLAAGRALSAADDYDPEGALARGLAKLEKALGPGADGGLDMVLGTMADDVRTAVEAAAGERRRIEIEYYTAARDEWSRRVVDPYSLFSTGGAWYLAAYCHRSEDERIFRMDRVRSVTLAEGHFTPPDHDPELIAYRPRPDDTRVTLDLSDSARWVVDQYPVEAVTDPGPLGGVRVTLAVSSKRWLERLMLRLGSDATVIEGDDRCGPAAARRLLNRYDRESGSLGAT